MRPSSFVKRGCQAATVCYDSHLRCCLSSSPEDRCLPGSPPDSGRRREVVEVKEQPLTPDRNRGRRAARFLVMNPQKEARRCTCSLRSASGIQLMMGLPGFLLYHSDDGRILRVFSVGRPCCTIVDSRSGTRTRRKSNGLVQLPPNAEAGPFVTGCAVDMSSETA